MIRVGIGGWTYEPWRGTFYPEKLRQADELHFASRAVTAIEINGTFYGTQKPESFRKWRDQTPDGFVFALKGPRYAVNRRVLAEAGDSINRFIDSGISELGDKLGPINWQFAGTKKFDAEDVTAFLTLLPKEIDGRTLRHVIEARHESFRSPEFITLLREYGAAAVVADSDDYPLIADVTTDFVYARLQRTREDVETGYTSEELSRWAERAKVWANGGEPDDLPLVADERPMKKKRDVFLFMIAGAKVRAPAAAQALIQEIGASA